MFSLLITLIRIGRYKGVKIKHIYGPETWMGGSIGSFFYDYMSLKDALKRENFDIIYERQDIRVSFLLSSGLM